MLAVRLPGPAVACVVLSALFLAPSAEATPRYAVRYNQDCNLCHHSPTGGGKRTSYAAQFLIPMELSALPTPEEAAETLDPQLSRAFSIGADLRTFYLYSEDEDYRQNFFQMQGDFYALLELEPKFSIYLDQGQTSTRELYGMGYVLPANGYVRVGRFIPAYGWLYDDHTLFVRELLGFAPPGHTDVGIEVGTHPGSSVLNLGLMNGAPAQLMDDDHRLTGLARFSTRRRVLGATLSAGASLAYSESDAGVRRVAGPFGSAKIGPVTWIGEADWTRDPRGGNPEADALVTSHELTWDLRRGLALRATYDFYDPDVDLQTGTLSAYGIGLDALIYPFLGLQVMAAGREVDEGPAITGYEDYVQPRLQVHFLY